MSAPGRWRSDAVLRRWRYEQQRILHRRLAFNRTMVALGCLVMIASASAVPVLPRIVRDDGGPDPIARAPPDDPDRGLIYAGLVPAKRGAPCAGAFEVVGATTCSLGPDAPPPGMEVTKTVAPVAPAAPPQPPPASDLVGPREVDVMRDAGALAPVDTMPAVIPDATPEALMLTVGSTGVTCDRDGQAGKRVQVLYTYEAGTPFGSGPRA